MANTLSFRSFTDMGHQHRLGYRPALDSDYDFLAQLHRDTTTETIDPAKDTYVGRRVFRKHHSVTSIFGHKFDLLKPERGRWGGDAGNRKRGVKRRAKNAGNIAYLRQQDALTARQMIELGIEEFERRGQYEPDFSVIDELIAYGDLSEEDHYAFDHDDWAFDHRDGAYVHDDDGPNDRDYGWGDWGDDDWGLFDDDFRPNLGCGDGDEDNKPRRHRRSRRKNNQSHQRNDQPRTIQQQMSHGRNKLVLADAVRASTPARVILKQKMRGAMKGPRPTAADIRARLFGTRTTTDNTTAG